MDGLMEHAAARDAGRYVPRRMMDQITSLCQGPLMIQSHGEAEVWEGRLKLCFPEDRRRMFNLRTRIAWLRSAVSPERGDSTAGVRYPVPSIRGVLQVLLKFRRLVRYDLQRRRRRLEHGWVKIVGILMGRCR